MSLSFANIHPSALHHQAPATLSPTGTSIERHVETHADTHSHPHLPLVYDFQILADTYRKLRPDLDAYFPLGKPDEPTPIARNGAWHVDSSKATKELGLTCEWKGCSITITIHNHKGLNPLPLSYDPCIHLSAF